MQSITIMMVYQQTFTYFSTNPTWHLSNAIDVCSTLMVSQTQLPLFKVDAVNCDNINSV